MDLAGNNDRRNREIVREIVETDAGLGHNHSESSYRSTSFGACRAVRHSQTLRSLQLAHAAIVGPYFGIRLKTGEVVHGEIRWGESRKAPIFF